MDLITNPVAVATAIAGFLGAITTIISSTAKGRKWWSEWWIRRKKKRGMPDLVCKIACDLQGVKEKQEFFAKELTANGGSSLKDEVRMLVSERMLEVKEALYPAFRTTTSGNNCFVNRAFAILCGTDDDTLMGLGWMGFMDTPAIGDEILQRWRVIAESSSAFAEEIRFRDAKGNDRGLWLVRANPIGSYGHDQKETVWCGRFFPKDEIAVAIAKEHHWRFVF
jgi:PAS domain-containing protein